MKLTGKVSLIVGELISDGVVGAELDVLYELANRAETRTMNGETWRNSLLPEIDRHEHMDFGIVGRDGAALANMANHIGLGDTGYIYMINPQDTVICDPEVENLKSISFE
jgi:hypothetical protein